MMLGGAPRIPVPPPSRQATVPHASAGGDVPPEPAGDDPKRPGGLVLARHLEQSIMIGDEVEVQVVGIRSGTARLKVVAPRSVAVHRREVFDAIRAEPRPLTEGRPSPDPGRTGKPSGGLVLTRSPRESIMIGDEVEVLVVEIRPTMVKIKITAPRTIPVHRREVYDSIREGDPSETGRADLDRALRA